MTSRSVALLAMLGLTAGCAATRALAPLGKGHAAITANLGGPFVEYAGKPIPLPDISVGGIYGLDDKTNVHAAVYLPTRVLLFGLASVDVGMSRQILAQAHARPRVMADLTAYVSYGDLGAGDPKGGFRVFPDLSAVASWDYKHITPFVGLDIFVDPWRPAVHPDPLFGCEIRSKHFGFEPEIMWDDFWRKNDLYPVTWYGPGNQGAIALHLGFHFYLAHDGRKS